MIRNTFLLMCFIIATPILGKADYTTIEKFLLGRIKNTPDFNFRDKVTNAHELTHVLHGQLRQKHCKKGENCLQLPDRKIYILAEPNILKSQISDYVPFNLKGKHFDHYVLRSKDWENVPSYLIDEWIAYYRGAQAGIESYNKLAKKRDVLSGLVELAVYSNAILSTVKAKLPQFYHSGNCLLYTSPSPRDKRQSRMPSSA